MNAYEAEKEYELKKMLEDAEKKGIMCIFTGEIYAINAEQIEWRKRLNDLVKKYTTSFPQIFKLLF